MCIIILLYLAGSPALAASVVHHQTLHFHSHV
jgi:hypothetical protein